MWQFLKYVVGVGTDISHGFHELNMQGGMETGYEIIESCKEISASGSVRERLHLNNDETAFYVRRLILEGDVPFAIDDLYVSSAKFQGFWNDLMIKLPFTILYKAPISILLVLRTFL